MDQQNSPPLKRATTAAILAVIMAGSFASGWAWWKGTWPFKNYSPPTVKEKVDLMADVENITPYVTFERYSDFRFPQVITGFDAMGAPVVRQAAYKMAVVSPDGTPKPLPEQPEWLRGDKVPSLPPFLVFPSAVKSAPDMEIETQVLVQEITRDMTVIIREYGFRLLPYSRPRRKTAEAEDFNTRQEAEETVSEASCATLTARIFTCKAGRKVWFRVDRLDIEGQIRADLDKPTLIRTVFASSGNRYGLSNYVIDEEYAAQAIKSVVRGHVREAFATRWQDVMPPDSRRGLQADPEEFRAAHRKGRRNRDQSTYNASPERNKVTRLPDSP